jgi:hypothetical protein
MLSDDVRGALLTITHVRAALDAVVVRGVRAVAGEQLRELNALAAEMDRIGASHVAAQLVTLAGQIDSGVAEAAGTLMTAISHARLLDRLLTLRAVSATYASARGDGDE